MTQTTSTEIKAYYEKAYTPRGYPTPIRPAGWMLSWTATGKHADKRVWDSQEQAESHIDEVLAVRDRRRAATAQTENETAAQAAATAQAENLATDRQVSYIMGLLAARAIRGTDDGFMSGPTTREGVTAMTRSDASAYITSLTGQY